MGLSCRIRGDWMNGCFALHCSPLTWMNCLVLSLLLLLTCSKSVLPLSKSPFMIHSHYTSLWLELFGKVHSPWFSPLLPRVSSGLEWSRGSSDSAHLLCGLCSAISCGGWLLAQRQRRTLEKVSGGRGALTPLVVQYHPSLMATWKSFCFPKIQCLFQKVRSSGRNKHFLVRFLNSWFLLFA